MFFKKKCVFLNPRKKQKNKKSNNPHGVLVLAWRLGVLLWQFHPENNEKSQCIIIFRWPLLLVNCRLAPPTVLRSLGAWFGYFPWVINEKSADPHWAVDRVGPNLQNKQQPSTEPAYQRKESEKNRNERREREKGKEKRERHKQRINPPTPWAVERVRTNLQKKQQPSTDAVHVVSQASWFLVYLTLHGSNIVGKLSSGSCFALGSSGGLSAFPLFSLPFFVPRVTFSRCGHWMDCEFALEPEWL